MKKIIAMLLFLALMASITGCTTLDRDYLDDIVIELDEQDAEIIIREWQFLLGSGAEIYYRKNGKMEMLGQTSGGDDGYCPFADGRYAVTLDGSTLLVRWYFNTVNGEEIWREQTITLPT